MTRAITGLLALLLAVPFAGAQEDLAEEPPKPRRYAVEIIVFTYEENVSVGTEVFPPDEPPPIDAELAFDPLATDAQGVAIDAEGNPVPVFTDTDTAGDDEEAGQDGPDLRAIDPVLMLADDFSMQRALEQLERLDVYRPIMHTGWTQSTLPPEESTALELAYFGKPPAGLAGSFMLYLGRYLHLVVDLTLDATGDDSRLVNNGEPILMFGDEAIDYDIGGGFGDGQVRYRIQEDRIVKNGDVRYFDHPRFGVIAKVTRIEEPEEDPGNESTSASVPPVASPGQ